MGEPKMKTLELDGNTVVLQILCQSYECVPGQRIRIVGKGNLLKLSDAIDSVLNEAQEI